MAKLNTHKLEIFCQEYVCNGFNQRQAAISAGCSKSSASTMAGNWLKMPHVMNRVNELIDDRLAGYVLTKEEVVAELNSLATFNMKDCYDDDGRLMQPSDLPRHIAACIKEVETAYNRFTGKTEVVKIKFHDKRAAVSDMMKYYNAFEDHQNSGATEFHVHLDEIDAKA